MRVGVFTALLGQFPLEKVIEKLKKLNIDTVELGTGNYPGDPHCKLSMLDNPAELDRFKKTIADNGLTISALSCHGNPAASRRGNAPGTIGTSRKTILLAEKLGVPVVIDFSGCPGDSRRQFPNWVTCPWPPEYLDVLAWQWDKVTIPFWKEHGKFAADHGVKIAIEMHPGFVVYSPETMLRAARGSRTVDRLQLRSESYVLAGNRPDRGDPAPRRLHLPRPRQGHADLRPQPAHDRGARHEEVHRRGNRAWIFRTVGYGHAYQWWSEFISTLRMFKYDYVLSIEHEDSLMSPDEGLTKAAAFLNQIVIREQPSAAWWV